MNVTSIVFLVIGFLGAILIGGFSIPQLYVVFKKKNIKIIHMKSSLILGTACLLLWISSLYNFVALLKNEPISNVTIWFTLIIAIANIVSSFNAFLLAFYKKFIICKNKNNKKVFDNK